MNKKKSPIVLLSDFGLKDPYVAMMKGVILSINPDVSVLDLTHQIEPQNVMQGALILEQSYRYFPQGSIFVCVVDPGVGTQRLPIAVSTQNYTFVGPDNGLMSLALEEKKTHETRALKEKKFWRAQVLSHTFHGRDLFASVAAHLSRDADLFKNLGPRVREFKKLNEPVLTDSSKKLSGVVIYIDQFGNAITNIPQSKINSRRNLIHEITVSKEKIKKLVRTYGEKKKKVVALINSSGHLEIAYPGGSAEKKAKIKVGDRVMVKFKN